MADNRHDFEPIIATRPSREPVREDAQPFWRLMLALGGGLVVVVLLAWWWLGRSSTDVASTTAAPETSAPAVSSDVPVEQVPAPPVRDAEPSAEIVQAPALPAPADEPVAAAEQASTPDEQAPASESAPAVVPNDAVEAPVTPAPLSVQFMSPDPLVRFELRGPLDSSPPLTSNVGEIVAVAPGTYRVVASGPQLENFEQEITFDGERPLKYTVELCAQRKYERESLAGRVVEEQACDSTKECESLFMLLSEHADQLVKARSFRTQQCAKWRREAEPAGKWTLDIQCGGATLATTCRIEIAEGACTSAGPRRSARGAACPRAELK